MNTPSRKDRRIGQRRWVQTVGLVGALTIGPIGTYAKSLNFKDIQIFSVSRVRSISGFALTPGKLHYVTAGQPYLFSAGIDLKAPYPDLVVRGVQETDFSADRWSYTPRLSIFHARTLSPHPLSSSSVVAVDGRFLRLRQIDLANKSEWGSAEIGYRRIHPPADPRGKAPLHEVERLQRDFVKALRALASDGQTIVTGITPLSATGKKVGKGAKGVRNTVRYLATTAAKGFPLVTIRCRQGKALRCHFADHCWLPVPKGSGTRLKDEAWMPVGVSYLKKERLLLVADAHKVHRYRFNSCYDIRHRGTIHPPKEIAAELTGIAIDALDRLWLSTSGLDNHHAANIYAWPRERWAP